MRARSASTMKLDSYDAGRELGQALAELDPDLVILFSSIHYDFAEQHAGLIDGLDRDDVTVFGGTGDGFFETRSAADIGAAALGIASEGALGVHVHVEEQLAADSRAAARRCAEAVAQAAGDAPLRLAMVLFDSLSCTDNRVIDGVNEVLDCPVFGGITSDDRKQARSYVLHDGRAHADAVGIIGFTGERLRFALAVENGSTGVGEIGHVEAAQGNTLERIDGLSALEFVAQRLGKAPETFTEQDIGVIGFQCSAKPDMSDAQYRSVSRWRKEVGALETYGPVEVGQHVRVVLSTSEELLSGADTVLSSLESNLEFEPLAGLAVSCAGRKWFLGPRFDEEAETVRARKQGLPFVGFPSLGEVSPRRRADGSYSPNMFHNVSLVLALLGVAPDR